MVIDKNRGGAYGEVVSQIRKTGPISFEEFMDIALYSGNGYYSKPASFGVYGDYYTSPSLHPFFGYLFAIQIMNIWEYMDRPNPFTIVEIGAGDGTLATDIVSTIRAANIDFSNCLQYIPIDRATSRGCVAGAEIVSADLLDLYISDSTSCVVLSNELIDALPVDIFEVRDGRTKVVVIDVDKQGNLKEELIETTIDEFYDLDISSLEGYRGPLCRDLGQWIPTVLDLVPKAFFVNIDYGYEESDYLSMGKSNRLLQTYYRHVDNLSPLLRVGDQDITAHVNFTALRRAFAHRGINSIGNITQREWLFGLGYSDVIEDLRLSEGLSRREISLIDRLVEVEGLGGFRVEISQRGIDGAEISKLNNLTNLSRYFSAVPPVTDKHMAFHLNR